MNSSFAAPGGAASPHREVLFWYALRIQTKIGNLASAILLDKGYETFLPLMVSRRRWSDRVKDVAVPLFPGYLFCRFDVNNRLPVLTTPGVLGIAGLGRTPLPVADEEIAAIRSIVHSGLTARGWPFLANGSRVYMESGPLAGLEGTLTNVDKVDHLIVSVQLLQRSIAVEVDRGWVRLAPTSANRQKIATLPMTYSCPA
jgi:transcription antitermination factor NusG